jgi:hypothetical protein
MSLKLGENAKLIAGIAPALQAAGDANGTVIDRFGFLDAIVHLKVGAASGTPTAQGVSLKIQTGDASDGSDMADVTDATIAALAADNAEAELNLDLSGYKQYIRPVVTTAFTGGTTPKIPVAVTVAIGNAVEIPV